MKLKRRSIIQIRISILIIIFAIAVTLIFIIGFKANNSINIVVGNTEQIVEADFIYSHSDAISFTAVVRSSGEKPRETEYKGLQLSKLFSSLNIGISNIEKITLNASDGYRIILSIEEVREANNVYLVFQRDGEYLKSKKRNGTGPFQLVIRQDPFSQRWIKHIDEIIMEK